MQRIFIIILLISAAFSCNKKEENRSDRTVSLGKIIYDTQIINPNPEDQWITESLSNLKKEKLIEILFEEVYSGKLVPVDYFTKERLSVEDIRALEKSDEFSRERIAQIKFDEKWEWDQNRSALKKQVESITIAYEVYNNFGEVRGYKPAFKLEFRGQ